MSEHSPAPWSIRQSATHVTVVTASGDAIFHDDKRLPGVMEDAHLISAAPEMLSALKAALSLIEIVTPFDGDETRMVRKAIAKAEGGAA